MAQGTVPDYFPKKRKGSTLPASKRPKISASFQEDSGDNPDKLSHDILTPKPAQKQARLVRGRPKTKNKQCSVKSNKCLESYFPKLGNPIAQQKLQDHDDMMLSTMQKPVSINQSKNQQQDIKETISLESGGLASSEQNDSIPVTSYENVASHQNLSGSNIAVEQPIEENVTSNMRKDVKSEDTAAASLHSDAKSHVEPLKSTTEASMEKEMAESFKLKTVRDLRSLQESVMKIHQLKKQQKQRGTNKEKISDKKPKADTSAQPSTPKKEEYALHGLSQKISGGLLLPYKYKILLELFRCTDSVVSLLFNRKQVVTWPNLQKSVQEMVRKNYEIHHLAQIKTVFPTGYQFRQEQGIGSGKDRTKKSEYQLTVEPMFDESDRFGGEKKFSGGMLTRRRKHFFMELISIVHKHHLKFLSQLNPPIEILEGKTVLRWHPQFPLDSIPEPEEAELPQPPEKADKCSNAKEILDKARSRFTKKAFDALKKVSERSTLSPEKVSPVCVEENNNECSKNGDYKTNLAKLKGISQSLLAKVRAKEAETKLKSMVRSEELTKKLQQLDNLPDAARALRMLYTSEKRACLPVEYICKKLVNCSTGILTEIAAVEHIQLLISTVPNWLNSVNIKSTKYVKMNKGVEMNVILERLSTKRRELANSV